MSLSSAWRVLKARLTRDRRDRELAEEMAGHRDMLERDLIATGWSASEARTEAFRRFGNTTALKEEAFNMWQFGSIETLIQDIRFGLRMLRRSPGFTLLAALCLAVGIGSNAAVYSWIEGILLRPYPGVVDQDRMMVIVGLIRGEAGRHTGLSWPDYFDLRANARLSSALAVDKITGTTLSLGDRAERVSGQIVSANYFDAIGVKPIMGRGFTPEEEVGRNAHPVVVIGYRMWQDRFKADPQILGKTQMMNGVLHTIVGVMPEGFTGTFVGYAMQFWVPTSMLETFDLSGNTLDDRSARWVESFARLAPGTTKAQAEQELQAIMRRLELRYPDTDKDHTLELSPLWKSPFNAAGLLMPTLRIAAVVAFFVLLIACANVSNLFLVRSLARRQELTVRVAIGAGRARLVRQLLTEGVLLTALAGAAGLVFAYWSRNLITRIIPPRGATLNLPAALDWRVLAACAAACLVTTLLFALVPALQTTRVDVATAMRGDAGGVVGGTGRSRIRSGLVVLQVSISFLLVVGAGLMVKSLAALRVANPGFSTSALISVIDLSSAGYTAERKSSFRDDLLDRVQAIPGVQSAAYMRTPPFSNVPYTSAPITIEGYRGGTDERPSISYVAVSPALLATLGIPLVAGRDFSRTDDESAPPVAIVNETMAARYWPGENPIGRYFELKGKSVTVVGVARTVNYQSLLEAPSPFYYVPLRQNPASLVVLCMRTALAPSAVMSSVVSAIHSLDPGLAPFGVITMREQIDRQASAQTVALSLVGAFGTLALLLAAVGLYGVMSYVVSQARRELGLRMALGAAAGDLRRLVLSHGLMMTGVGVVIGAALALGTTRLLGALLYHVSPRDPATFAGSLVALSVAAVAACLVPAWRAARTDPVTALRG